MGTCWEPDIYDLKPSPFPTFYTFVNRVDPDQAAPTGMEMLYILHCWIIFIRFLILCANVEIYSLFAKEAILSKF